MKINLSSALNNLIHGQSFKESAAEVLLHCSKMKPESWVTLEVTHSDGSDGVEAGLYRERAGNFTVTKRIEWFGLSIRIYIEDRSTGECYLLCADHSQRPTFFGRRKILKFLRIFRISFFSSLGYMSEKIKWRFGDVSLVIEV